MPERKKKMGPDPKAADHEGKAKPGSKSGRKTADDFSKKTRPQASPPARHGNGGEPRRIETRKIALLRPHPRQDDLFRPLPDQELRRLAESMRCNGQDVPVEITPDNEIISGHQRVRAAQLLGWEQIQVWVRDDLAGDEKAIELRLIEANRVRRQLDMLDMVRLARRELEIQQGLKPGGLSQCAERGLCEQVGRMVGRSRRHVQRLVNVLNAPMEVQQAYSEGKVPIQLAERVARLEVDAQEEIAGAIAAGGDPAGVVAAHLPAAIPAEIDPNKEYDHFLTSVTHAVEVFDGRVEEVVGGMDLDREIETLKQANSLIAELIARHKALKKQRAATLKGLDDWRGGHDRR